jgi:uncharacterized protein YkwD
MMRPLLLCLAICAQPLLASPPPVATGMDALTAEQKLEAKTRMEEYQKSAFDPLERRSVIREVLRLSRPVQTVFLGIVDTDFSKALTAYRTLFKKTTDTLTKDRESKETKDEIKRLQAAVMSLRAMGDSLTKEKIVEIGDPALKKLRSYLTFNREGVMKADPTMDIPRERLLALVTCRQELRQALGIKDGKDYSPEKLLEEERSIADKPAPVDRDAAKVMAANKQLQTGVPTEEVEGVRVTNQLRATLGLSALLIDPKLCSAARGHSKDMAEKKFFAHDSPVPGKKTPWDRAKLAGTSANAENIFAGSAKPEDAVMAWWHSPGHFVNMLNPGHKRMAMGRHEGHWTQMFGG